jgi:diamine N-acetyltransferase
VSLFFRQCTHEDIDVLRDFSYMTFFETFAHMNAPEDMEAYLNKAFEIEKLRAELLDVNSSFYFLYSDEKLAGYLKLNEAFAQTDIHDSKSLEIERIYVSKEFQGEGLGGYLMDRAINIANLRKKLYVWLGVWEKNEKALCFYKKNGFYYIGKHSFFMGEDEQTDYIMRKNL